MPVRQDYISVRKVQAFEKYLLMAGMEHLWNRIEKWSCRRIICNLMRRTLEAGREKK